MLALGLVVLVGCGPAASEDTDNGAAAVTRTWSKDRFGLEVTEPGAYSNGDAYWMAVLSGASYENTDKIKAQLQTIGLGNAEMAFFENKKTDTQAFYVGTPTAGVVVFTGSRTFHDWITDLKFSKVPSPFGKIHLGYSESFASIWEDNTGLTIEGAAKPGEGLRTFLMSRHSGQAPVRPLYLTGHSMGGALATLAFVNSRYEACAAGHSTPRDNTEAYVECAKEAPKLPIHAIYTFGSPRTGDKLFASLAAGDGIWDASHPFVQRFVNNLDLVPNVPPRFLGFWHPERGGDEKASIARLTKSGEIRRGADAGGDWKGKIKDLIADHRATSYIALILRAVSPDTQVTDPDDTAVGTDYASEYAAAPADAIHPIEATRLGGDARKQYDALALSGEVAAYEVIGTSHRMFEVRTMVDGGTTRALKQSYLFDEAFRAVVAVNEVEDPDAPNGIGTQVSTPDAHKAPDPAWSPATQSSP